MPREISQELLERAGRYFRYAKGKPDPEVVAALYCGGSIDQARKLISLVKNQRRGGGDDGAGKRKS